MPRILLVEDDVSVRLILVEILSDASYEVDAARSFATAAAILDSRDYDLLITDANFSDGAGTVLADRAAVRGIPALIVTGNALDPRLDPAKYVVLAKPMRTQVLLDAVGDALRRP